MTGQILAALPGLFGGVNTPVAQPGAAPGDVFEIYVFGLVLEAARREQAVVSYENVNGPFTGIATFRTTPGRIWSTAAPYTHAILQFQGKPALEVHLGVYLEGNPAGLTRPTSSSSLDPKGSRAERDEFSRRRAGRSAPSSASFTIRLSALTWDEASLG